MTKKNPDDERHKKILALHSKLRSELRSLINANCVEANALGVKFPDPHIAIIAAMQVALAEAGCAYLVFCGVKPNEAFERVIQASGVAMQNWVHTILRENMVKNDKVSSLIVDPNTAPVN